MNFYELFTQNAVRKLLCASFIFILGLNSKLFCVLLMGFYYTERSKHDEKMSFAAIFALNIQCNAGKSERYRILQPCGMFVYTSAVNVPIEHQRRIL